MADHGGNHAVEWFKVLLTASIPAFTAYVALRVSDAETAERLRTIRDDLTRIEREEAAMKAACFTIRDGDLLRQAGELRLDELRRRVIVLERKVLKTDLDGVPAGRP